ncbi:hypothetical protein ACFX2J_023609 [Malus domestica]
MSKNTASWFMSLMGLLSGCFRGETKRSRSERQEDGPEAWNVAAAKHFSSALKSDPIRAPTLVPELRISTIATATATSHSLTAPSSESSPEMAKASKGHHDEFEDDDEVSHGVKVEGQGREKNRSKHSETEQRRRSKINERFQMLRDIIPQNDQKRDKASLLLEVIEYIQFLQEKVNLYEGSYQGWSPEPTKLVPWKSHNRSGENFVDQSQVMNDGSGHENNVVVSPAMIPNSQNSVESNLGSAVAYKALDHIAGLATQSVPNVQQVQQQSIFDSVGTGVSTQPLQESITDAQNMACRPQFPSWAGITSSTVSDGKLNKHDEHSGSGSISSAYSQGVLNNLTQALQSAGLDLSLASISVQMDVVNRADSGLTSVASSSKAHVNQSMNNQMMTQAQVSSCDGGLELAHKRFRTRES